ncbi:hypothetical protein KGM_202306 [Danaus plexippus plexippus]|uniref:Uncharacterized protein n=2 Tax=Danaus plexippus TaxID=13037 RepID=A0A212ENJ1_DANPL|nr:hypothetical protein KGM_202306 [Danaus plexippus plexippus]
MSPALGWANTLGIKNAKVYRISGLTKVDEYDIVEGEKKTIDKKEINSEELET